MRSKKKQSLKRNLLVCVVKRKSDLKLLIEQREYRAPLVRVNPAGVEYAAFYLPSGIFKGGGRIEMYGKISEFKIKERASLHNLEVSKAQKDEKYILFSFSRLYSLKDPIENSSSMRVTFKRTDFKLLRKAHSVAQLYDIKPLEEIMYETLQKTKIPFKREYNVKIGERRYRLDFAFFCKDRILALECDSKKWHSQKAQSERDKERDSLLENAGVRVVHFDENQSLLGPDEVALILQKEMKKITS
ncbi:MAG: DUF559 domain-containing protein [bacterium]|nr:DUF559 domain-containing protein [bacterium]